MTNNKFFLLKLPEKFRGSLLILTLFSQCVLANTNYDLPQSKQQMEICEREALTLHNGAVEQERVFNQQNKFKVRYEIQANDGSEWAVLCDLTTGKIIGEQKMLGDGK